jgi:UPF0716 family protein affecting phage T7 exclusion
MWFYFVAAGFAVADVGTLLILANYIGVSLTLAVVAISTFSGLVSCTRVFKHFEKEQKTLTEERGTNRSQQEKHYMAAEITLLFISMFLFIFPGLLSDFLAYILLIPVFRGKVRELVRWCQTKYREQSVKFG